MMKGMGWLLLCLAALAGCARGVAPVSVVVTDRTVEEALAASRRVIVEEGYDLAPSETGLTVEGQWASEGHRDRHASVTCGGAEGMVGVELAVIVAERRRTPGGWAEARVDERAAGRLLEGIVEVLEATPAFPPAAAPPPAPPPEVARPPAPAPVGAVEGQEILLRVTRTPSGGVVVEPVAAHPAAAPPPEVAPPPVPGEGGAGPEVTP